MCVYYRGTVVLLIYVDDGIFIAPLQSQIDEAYKMCSNEFQDDKGECGIRHSE